MAYTAVPDQRIPYDNDGTVVATGDLFAGVQTYPTGGNVLLLQGRTPTTAITGFGGLGVSGHDGAIWLFFPEQREVTAYAGGLFGSYSGPEAPTYNRGYWQGSNDTTNGLDGTWETASLPGGTWFPTNLHTWRAVIRPISFTGGKRTVRNAFVVGGDVNASIDLLHLYGEKVAGQTPNDLIFINHDDTPGVEYAAVEDFGDRPLATSVVRQFRVKNVSGSLTANGINLQCNDADFAISTDNVNWVVTINIASLAPGAESATMYVRNTTPAVGSLLGPRFARIVAIVGSWT